MAETGYSVTVVDTSVAVVGLAVGTVAEVAEFVVEFEPSVFENYLEPVSAVVGIVVPTVVSEFVSAAVFVGASSAAVAGPDQAWAPEQK